MSGTLPSIPLSQRFDPNGELLSGGLLYLYQASTVIAVTAYSDYNLTLPMPNPIVLDADGMVPMFFLADGTYRARLTDATSARVIFDEPALFTVAASGGGVGGGTVTENPAFTTGDIIFQALDLPRTGWVRANGRTIGNAASAGTERASADTSALFAWHYAYFDNLRCPVSGGRGANATADFAAGKTITLLDLRGLVLAGMDGMGNTASSRLPASTVPINTGTNDTGGALVGSNIHQLTVAQMPAHNHTGVLTLTDHTHSYLTPNVITILRNSGTSGNLVDSGTLANTGGVTTAGWTTAGGGGTVSINPQGADGQHNNMPLGMIGCWLLRL